MNLQMGKIQIIMSDTVLMLHPCVVFHGSGNAVSMDIWVGSSEMFTAH